MSVGFALMAAILCWLLHSWGGAAQTPPSPRILSPTQGDTADPSLTITSDASSSTGEDDASEAADDGFPTVDWAYWQGVNPDVIGWITVPGTTINSPIVQAPTDDPDFYLSHDVYGNYNIYGAIYLDAECAEAGLDSRNAVILGHHSGIWKPRPSASSKSTRTKPSPPGTPQSFFRLRSGNGPTRCGSRRSSTVWNHPREPSSTMMRISACGTTRCGWTPP